MTAPSNAITQLRKCTICGDDFRQVQRAGRPAAFCSDFCKQIGKRTAERKCIVCGTVYPKGTNPFYCSEECRTSIVRCYHCGKPSERKFCSVECVQAAYPPPYECKNCGRDFLPKQEWIDRSDFSGPPRYCGPACVEQAQVASGRATVRILVDESSWISAMERSSELFDSAMPTKPSGAPYLYIRKESLDRFTPGQREQNAINFWNWVLDSPRTHISSGAREFMAEYLAYGAFVRGVAGPDTPDGIMRAWGVWPYIGYQHPELLVGSMSRVLEVYLRLQAVERKRLRAKTKADIRTLLQQAESVYNIAIGLRDAGSDTRNEHTRFINKWLRPLPELGGSTRLAHECKLYLKAAEPLPLRAFTQLSVRQCEAIESSHAELNMAAVEAITSKRRQLPWGPRPATVPMPDERFNETLQRALMGGLQIGES